MIVTKLVLLTLSGSADASPNEAPSSKVDHNFGCVVQAGSLRTWNPRGYTLPRGIAAKFRWWNSAETPDAPQKSECAKMTPAKHIIGLPGKGSAKWFDLVVAQEDVNIYRGYSKGTFHCGIQTPAAKFGAWWTFESPLQKGLFRKRNAVCSAWNDLSLKTRCRLKAGTMVAVGPTQSVRCEGQATCAKPPNGWRGEYLATDQAQIFLNLRGRSPDEISKFLTDCQTSTWTGRE